MNLWNYPNRMAPLVELPALIDAVINNGLVGYFWYTLYVLIRLVVKKIASMLQPLVKRVNSTLMDEIVYRSILIAFPISL